MRTKKIVEIKKFNNLNEKIINNQIYVCAHSNDALNKRLDDYKFVALKYIRIDGIRV